MQNTTTNTHTTKKGAFALVALTLLSALGCSILGYLALPFASGFYAGVLSVEKRERRFFSYALPVITFLINFFINGLFSLEGIGYAILGAVIYFCYRNEKSKAELTFFASLLTFILVAFSLVFLAFERTEIFSFSEIKGFYYNIFTNTKEQILNLLTQLTVVNDEGVRYFAFTVSEAEDIFFSLVALVIPVLMILSFLIAGLSLIIYDKAKSNRHLNSIRKSEWDFTPSNIVAYFYITISIFAMLAEGNGVLTLSLSSLSILFMIIFAYVGIKTMYRFFSQKTSGLTAFLLIFTAILLFYSFAIQLFSYIGAFFAISKNKRKKISEN